MNVKIYVEGGGDSSALKRQCRHGFSEFFRRSGLEGRMPRIVASGSRGNAFDDFCTAIQNTDGSPFVMLLVDSERGIFPSDRPWEHVLQRDGWTRPFTVGDDSLHFMVQCMEAWFVADKDSLKMYYGHRFNSGRLPGNPEIEAVTKADLYTALRNATRQCAKGQYTKGRDSFRILATVDPETVAEASPYAKRLLDILRAKL